MSRKTHQRTRDDVTSSKLSYRKVLDMPPENRSKSVPKMLKSNGEGAPRGMENCCSSCSSRGKITMVIKNYKDRAFKNTCFCDKTCYKKFCNSLRNERSLKSESCSQPQLFKCSHCKKFSRSTVQDPTKRVPGTFCSLKCLQGFSIRVPKSLNPNSTGHASITKESSQGIPQAVEIFSSDLSSGSISVLGTQNSSIGPPALVSLQEIDEISLSSSDSSTSPTSKCPTKQNCRTGQDKSGEFKLDAIDPNVESESKAVSSSEKTESMSVLSDPILTRTLSNCDSLRVSTSPTSLISSSTTCTTSSKTKAPPTFHTYETYSVFDWNTYLKEQGGEPAPSKCFTQNPIPPKNEFQIGMKLEAKDPRNSSCTCLATVVALWGSRIQLRLVGSDSSNDFWELVDSENIHPIGYCEKIGDMLQPPLSYTGSLTQWHSFLISALKDASPAPDNCFVKPPVSPERNLFKVGMKLEAIDRKNPRLICPATIGSRKGDLITITFDGWKGAFDYECRYTSRDIFPVGWCEKSGHPLQPPGNQAPTHHKQAKMMSMTSYTGMSLVIQNSKFVTDNKTSPEITSIKSLSETRTKQRETTSKKCKSVCESTARVPPVQQQTKLTHSSTPIINHERESSAVKRKVILQSNSTSAPSLDPKPAKSAKTMKQHDTSSKSCTLVEEKTLPSSSAFDDAEERVESVASSPPPPRRPTGDPKDWSVDDVVSFILSCDPSLSPHAETFKEHEIDGKALLMLTSETMMKYMDMRLGPALKIISSIEDQLKS